MDPSRLSSSADLDESSADARVPVDLLADDFLERLRRGEKPSIEEYVKRNPELAEEIRELFPTLALLENCVPAVPAPAEPRSAHASLLVPRRLGDYRIVREIGRGGMGVVYEAEHETLRRRVALKLLPAQLSETPTGLQRFLREARAAGQLHHTNIVPVFEVGVHEQMHFYAMQYIHGQNLDAVIDELRQLKETAAGTIGTHHSVATHAADRSALSRTVAHELLTGSYAGPLDASWSPEEAHEEAQPPGDETPRPASSTFNNGDATDSGSLTQVGHSHEGYYQRVARVGLQVAEALQFAHRQGILHRDIKPSNLILDTAGTVWVTDFGLAKHEGDDFTHTGDIVGTLRYMAPERLHGQADERSDVYSLGLTLYELTTLHCALEGEDRVSLVRQIEDLNPPRPRKLVPDIPRDLETIILKAIDKSPAHRYQSAGKLSEDLQLFLADRPILARRSTWTERGWRWCRRNPIPAALTSCVTALLILLFVGSLAFALFSMRQASLLTQQTLSANQAQHAAEKAKEEAVRRLYESCLGQARAGRWSARAGQHFDTLASLRQAAEILPTLQLHADEQRQRRLVLRNEAIAAMTLVDLKEVRRWDDRKDATAVVAFPPDYSLYAMSDRKGNIIVSRVADDMEVTRLSGPGYRAWLLTFSPDGRYLAGKFHRGEPAPTRPIVRVWDLTTRQVVIEEKQKLSLARMAFRGDCEEFALGLDSHEVRLYQLPTGTTVTNHSGRSDPLDLCYDATGTKMAITYPGVGPVEIWDRTNDASRFLQVAPDVNALAWSPAGNTLAMGTYTGEIFLQNMQHPDRPPRKLEGHMARVVQVAFNHRGDLLMSRAWDSTVRFWQVSTGLQACRHDVMPWSGTGFRRDDSQLAFRAGDGSFGLWEMTGGGPLRILSVNGGASGRSCVAFHSSRQELLASATSDGVELWDIATADRVKLLPVRGTKSVVFSPDGQGIFTSGPAGVQFWPLSGNSMALAQLQVGEPETIVKSRSNRVDLASDGSFMAVDHDSRNATVIDLKDRETLSQPFQHHNVDYAIISPDARWVVTTTWHGQGVRVWDAKSGSGGKRFRDLAPQVISATPAFSPDGRYLAVSDGEAHYLWEVGSWRQVYRIKREHPDGWPGPVAFSPDSRMLAVAHTRYVAQLIEAASGRTLGILEAPTSASLSGYSFSANGRYLAVAETENIQLWDLQAIRARLADMQIDWALASGEAEVELNDANK